jgi:hypothetical protein
MLDTEELFSVETSNTPIERSHFKIINNNNTSRLEYFTNELLSIVDNKYECINIYNYVTYTNNLFVFSPNNQQHNSPNKFRFYEKDVLYVLKPELGSRIYIANFDVNCKTSYLYHIDIDTSDELDELENNEKKIMLYEDKILSCFKKCKDIVEVTSENNILIDFSRVEFSEEVNKLDKPEELTNFINNLKLNEEDLLIRFTIDKNGLVSNPIILLEL